MELTAFFNYADWPGNYRAGGNQPSVRACSYEMKSVWLMKKFFSPAAICANP